MGGLALFWGAVGGKGLYVLLSILFLFPFKLIRISRKHYSVRGGIPTRKLSE